jgi:cell division protein FtsW
MSNRLKTDWYLFITIVAMVFFGALMIFSASSVMASFKMGSSYYFLIRQIFWIVVAVLVMMGLKTMDYHKLQHPAVAFVSMGLAIMLLIVVFFADPKQHRWIRLGPGGLLGVQPSELAKPALIIFMAFFIALRSKAINTKYTLLPAAVAVGVVTLAVVVADLGTAVVLVATAATLFFIAGLEWRFFMLALLVALVGSLFAVASKPYRLTRIIGYLDPGYKVVQQIDQKLHINLQGYLKKSLTTKDTSYQSEQAKIAVGSGGLAGAGLMQSKQKEGYLPEPHTDFIYAIVGEEFGLIGSAGVLIAFVVVLWRGVRTTVLVPDDFGRYLALGVTTMIVVQAFMNMSVVLGMMPTKGIPLPMISFGGSSLLSTLACLGILLNVSEHAG